jgi:prolyl 4-hydroxylase
VKRTKVDIDAFLNLIQESLNAFTSNILSMRPIDEDVNGAVDGLLRLQKMYHLKTKDIADGIIDGEKTSNKLSPSDLYVIASEAQTIENEQFLALEYLKKTLEVLNESKDSYFEVDIEELKQNIQELSTDPNAHVDVFNEEFEHNKIFSIEKETIHFRRICRKEGIKSPKETASLKCRYISRSPYSLIGPFKIEEIDKQIELVLLHDVLYDSEIEILKNLSLTRFVRGSTLEKDLSSKKSRLRTAKIAWFTDDVHEVVDRISKRVEVKF